MSLIISPYEFVDLLKNHEPMHSAIAETLNGYELAEGIELINGAARDFLSMLPFDVDFSPEYLASVYLTETRPKLAAIISAHFLGFDKAILHCQMEWLRQLRL